MDAPPRDVDETRCRRWWVPPGLEVVRLDDLPVGVDSHHWDLRTGDGRRFLLTLDLRDAADRRREVLARAPAYVLSLDPYLEPARAVTAEELTTEPARGERAVCRGGPARWRTTAPGRAGRSRPRGAGPLPDPVGQLRHRLAGAEPRADRGRSLAPGLTPTG